MDMVKSAVLLFGLLVASAGMSQAADTPLTIAKAIDVSAASQAGAGAPYVSVAEQDPWSAENHIENVRTHMLIVYQARAESCQLRKR